MLASGSAIGNVRAQVQRMVSMVVVWAIVAAVSVVAKRWLGDGDGEPSNVEVVDATAGPLLSDVGGLRAAKEELRYALVLPLQHPRLFFGGSKAFAACKGVLLVGPPGTGKTMLVRAAARESGATFIAPTLNQLEQKWYGETSKVLNATFDAAIRRAPAVVFFDEIDGVCRTRQADEGCSYGLKTELLRQIDRVPNDAAVVVVACTNCAALLDPALKRRLPTVLKIDLPDQDERHDILRLCCRDEGARAPVRALAKATAGFSGSDLQALYQASARRRMRRVLERERGSLGALDASSLPPLSKHDWEGALRAMRAAKAYNSESQIESTASRDAMMKRLAEMLRR